MYQLFSYDVNSIMLFSDRMCFQSIFEASVAIKKKKAHIIQDEDEKESHCQFKNQALSVIYFEPFYEFIIRLCQNIENLQLFCNF